MYNSEHGQDKWLNEHIFQFATRGTFVEFGALDGVLHSNSLFFEQSLGWDGLCIEANPSAFEKLRMNRQCLCENYAIAPHSGVANFRKISGGLFGWSGIEEFIEPQHKTRIAQHIPESQQELVQVPCITLNEILDKHHLYNIDYMSIDVEGAEYAILKGFDFDKFKVDVFDIENNFNNFPLNELMESKGYVKIARLDVNDIYRKK